MSRQDHFERILASLHEATFDDSLWPATSALIDDACGSTGNGLVVCQGIGESAGIAHASFFRRGQPCEDLQREYLQVYHQLDERAPRLRLLADNQLVHVSSLFSEEELKTSAVYNELLFRLGARDGLNVRLDGPAGCHIFWGTGDPSGSAGWEPDQIDMMKRLLPHIRHFVWVRRALDDAEALAASLSGLLDNTRLGIIQLDHRRRIVEVNDRARSVLRQPRRAVREGRVSKRPPGRRRRNFAEPVDRRLAGLRVHLSHRWHDVGAAAAAFAAADRARRPPGGLPEELQFRTPGGAGAGG